jgi:amino acid permease
MEERPVKFHLNLDFMLTVTTIMKTVIGAGIISLPSTISKLGYVFGLCVYLLAVAINYLTALLLLKSKNLARHSNYTSIMRHLFDSKTAMAISSFIILLNNLGICIA